MNKKADIKIIEVEKISYSNNVFFFILYFDAESWKTDL